MTWDIEREEGEDLDLSEVLDVYRSSGLGERRPLLDEERMAAKLRNANFVATCRIDKKLAGIASFISADGQLRFVIDHGTDFTWLSVLRGIDGEKDVRTLCADAGCELEAVAEFIDQSILEGLLIRARETR